MDNTWVFIGMVFVAVVLLAQGMIIPVFGESRHIRKRLKQRLTEIDRAGSGEAVSSILRAKYLQTLSPWEARLEALPFMENLSVMIEQAGHNFRAYRVVLVAIMLAVVAMAVCWFVTRSIGFAGVAAVIGLAIPFWKIKYDRTSRMAKFEEQLPDAIDVMRRALMAGHPFNASLGLVADDMDEPISTEFRTVFADVNYGNDVRRAMLGLLSRIPSVTVMALTTSVLVQRETGGNLAEILEQIGTVIRGRFKFQRTVKTLSAEGRMSAWVLAMVPLGLFVILSIQTPDYFPILLESEFGQKLIIGTFVWAMIGVYFIRKILRIDV